MYLRPAVKKDSEFAHEYRCPNCNQPARLIPGENRELIVVHEERCAMRRFIAVRYPVLYRKVEKRIEECLAA
jgi:hypothetical protein